MNEWVETYVTGVNVNKMCLLLKILSGGVRIVFVDTGNTAGHKTSESNSNVFPPSTV
jgi:hypothetical protein